MSENARKAVITTAQVQTALDKASEVRATLTGKPVEALTFDKGARGKGFAVYTANDTVVTSFETKEEAFIHYNRWAEVATEVLGLIETNKSVEVVPAKAPAKTPAKAAEKPAA
jgi:hypothetical protein